MKTETLTVYFCDHCGRHSFSKGGMTLHEKHCREDPVNKPLCFSCAKFREYPDIKKKFVYADPGWEPDAPWDGRHRYELTLHMCEQTKKGMFFHASKDKERTIRSQSDWEHCPTEAEGCPHYERDFFSLKVFEI